MNQKIINLGILAHVDAGKTTLTEAFLMHSGVKSAMGRVDDGTTATDFLPIERRRGMTVRAATVSFEYNGCKINLIDTPGHMDFIAEVMRTLSVLDGVILVISAKESVQVQTREIFKRLLELKLPVLFFVNKLDRTGVDLDKVICDIKSMLTPDLVVMQEVLGAGTKTPAVKEIPIDDRRITELVVLSSEKLFAKYSSGGKLLHHEIARKLYWKVRDAKLFPVYFGNALSDIGTIPIMNERRNRVLFGGDSRNRGIVWVGLQGRI